MVEERQLREVNRNTWPAIASLIPAAFSNESVILFAQMALQNDRDVAGAFIFFQ